MEPSPQLPFGVALPERSPREVREEGLDPGDLSRPHFYEVGIPMRDGLELAADIYLPAAERLPAPAVVLGTPYDKRAPIDSVVAYQEAGYVGVIYDIRGRGKSEGVFDPFAADGVDGHDVVEWAAGQEWCDGSVAVSGLSYGGWTAMATVAERPRAVKAAIATASAGRWQQEIPYAHGCFSLSLAGWYAFTRRRINDVSRDRATISNLLPLAAIGEAIDASGPAWDDAMEHEALDDFWRARRWDGEYDFDVPILHVAGWFDRDNAQGAFHHYEQMLAGSPARDRQWLLVGPWSHVSTRFPTDSYQGFATPDGALDMDAIHVRFLDRFLRGEANGIDEEPRVRLYDPGVGEWKARGEWQGGVVGRDLYLDAEGALADSPGEDGETSYDYDPRDPEGIPFDQKAVDWELPLELGGLEAQDGVLTWTTEPLAEPLTVHGWGEFELHAATDGEDTDWHVKLTDVDAEGTSRWVTWGCLRASHSDDPGAPSPLVPNEAKRYAVELCPTFHTFRAGHRLRLVLASSEFPAFARNLNRFGPIARQDDPRVARNTVFHGGTRASRLRLRVEEPG
jgi:putative CocE/NonD family hydrolase